MHEISSEQRGEKQGSLRVKSDAIDGKITYHKPMAKPAKNEGSTVTSQTSEILLLDGRFELLHSLPLHSYLEPRGINIRAMSKGSHTGLYRGYVGLWEVFHETLFLIGLLDFESKPTDPATIFGELRFPICADWYSGRLEIDRGARLFYFHMGWGSQYAERLRVYVERGRVVTRRSYDQRNLLLRRFNAHIKEYEEFRQQVAAHGSSAVGPLGGFTAAGLKVIGQPPADDAEPWPDGLNKEELAEWIEPMLAHCARPTERMASLVQRSASSVAP